MDCPNLNFLLEIPEEFSRTSPRGGRRLTDNYGTSLRPSDSDVSLRNPDNVMRVFRRILSEWLRYVHFCQTKRTFSGSLFATTTLVISEYLHFGSYIPSEMALKGLYLMYRELVYYADSIRLPHITSIVRENLSHGIEYMIHNVTAMVCLLAKNRFAFSDRTQLRTLINLILSVMRNEQFITRNGSTLLHVAVSTFPESSAFVCHNTGIFFPCNATTTLLLECGADPNSVDRDGNTPLHIIAMVKCLDSSLQSMDKCLAIADILLLLIENGAHKDARNRFGLQPIDLSATGIADAILECHTPSKLWCMCAAIVARNRMLYPVQRLPSHLRSLIIIH